MYAKPSIVQCLHLLSTACVFEITVRRLDLLHDLVQGKQGRLKGRTFSAPRKWARGKGRITCQFGCCYNYAIDSEGRRPGVPQRQSMCHSLLPAMQTTFAHFAASCILCLCTAKPVPLAHSMLMESVSCTHQQYPVIAVALLGWQTHFVTCQFWGW